MAQSRVLDEEEAMQRTKGSGGARGRGLAEEVGLARPPRSANTSSTSSCPARVCDHEELLVEELRDVAD